MSNRGGAKPLPIQEQAGGRSMSSVSSPVPSFMSSPMAILVILWFVHFANDALMGFWVIHKTLAGLDLVKSGLIASAALFVGNLSQVAFGYLGDRGWRDIILPLGLLGPAAMCFLGMSENYILIACMVFVASLGSASFHPLAAGVVAQIDPPRRALMMSIFITGGFLGFGFSQIIYTQLYNRGTAMVAMAVVVPVCAAIAVCFLPRAPKKKHDGLRAMWNDSHGMRAIMAVLYVLVVCAAAANVGIIFLLPEIMTAFQASDFMIFGGAHMIMVVGGGIGIIPFGYLSDRIGPRQSMLLASVGSCVMMLVLCVVSASSESGAVSDLHLQIIFAIFGLCSGACFPIAIAYGNALLPQHGSTVSAVFMGGAWALGSFGPSLLVWIAGDMSASSVAKAILSCGGFWLIAIIVCLILPKARSFAQNRPE